MQKIDIHGCTVSEAKVRLNQCLNTLNPLQQELSVIHGYSSKVLLNYVRKNYQHPRVIKKILTMNKGETIFIVRSK